MDEESKDDTIENTCISLLKSKRLLTEGSTLTNKQNNLSMK